MALAVIAADKRHLVNPAGQPFFALGVNYSGYFDRAWHMWETALYDPKLIALDLRKAQQSGFNTVRLFAHTALLEEIRQGKFAKLDEVLTLAQSSGLLVCFTLNDAHYLDLGRVGELDAKIAARYKTLSTIFAYDLENEPVFYNLAAAVYPASYRPPLHSTQLIDHYGQRVSRQEALDLQSQRRIPSHLDPDTAYYYINALRLFLEYDAAVNTFVKQGKGTLVDFMLAPESEPWRALITVLDGTVAAWLRARTDPLRAAGCRQLLTVGWNWLHFAALPANRALDFQQYHKYGSSSMADFSTQTAQLEALRRAFPDHPLIFGEFGWSNQSGQTPAASQPVPPDRTALYEAAIYAYLRANGFAGGFKWMLNDLQGASNPYEASFGVFAVGDQPKPIRDLTQRFSQNWLAAIGQTGTLTLRREVEAGLAYRLDLPGQLTVGGHAYQDEAVSWQAEGIGHCFIRQNGPEVLLDSLGVGRLALDPWDWLSTWDQRRETVLYQVSGSSRTRLRVVAAGQSVEIDLRPGAQYAVTMGAELPVTPTPPPDVPTLEPKPGEHVALLGDFDAYMSAALKYLRRFAPDLTFAAGHVAGRWPYVTVIAPPEQVSDAVLETIRGAGALLVERVIAATPTATQTLLDDLAQRGQRFLSTATSPQAESPTPPVEPTPSTPVAATYIVQPGDTLGKIARQVYGDANKWNLIFEANRDKLTDPGLIRVGMELRLPEK